MVCTIKLSLWFWCLDLLCGLYIPDNWVRSTMCEIGISEKCVPSDSFNLVSHHLPNMFDGHRLGYPMVFPTLRTKQFHLRHLFPVTAHCLVSGSSSNSVSLPRRIQNRYQCFQRKTHKRKTSSSLSAISTIPMIRYHSPSRHNGCRFWSSVTIFAIIKIASSPWN